MYLYFKIFPLELTSLAVNLIVLAFFLVMFFVITVDFTVTLFFTILVCASLAAYLIPIKNNDSRVQQNILSNNYYITQSSNNKPCAF